MREARGPWCWLLLAALHLPAARVAGSVPRDPLSEFARHNLVTLQLIHGETHNEIPSTLEQNGRHVKLLAVKYELHNREYVLDLFLNLDLIPKSYFEKYQRKDDYEIRKSEHLEVMCHYHGHIRGIPRSWAAISTCNGTSDYFSGAIFDGNEMHYLENSPYGVAEEVDLQSGRRHFLYSSAALRANFSCGVPSKIGDLFLNQRSQNVQRFKRDIELTWSFVHGPYSSNEQSRYVELVLVVDSEVNENRGNEVFSFCKQVVNIVSRMYSPLNIYIALVGVVAWNLRDEISITSSSDDTLTNFLQYRKNMLLKDHPNDNAYLLMGKTFNSGIVGKAMKGSMCSSDSSGGVIMDHSRSVGMVAHTLAHEMGHNFGMEHDEGDCRCDSKFCIMAPSVSSDVSFSWSVCSLEYIAVSYEQGLDYCLRNKPKRLFQGPVCGNGFVENGEQCDCGLEAACGNPCCNSSTCRLQPGAECATGHCCDLQRCRMKPAGTLCRAADRECDLPEFCTGKTEYCPNDVFKVNGEACRSGQAFCYQGLCRTHNTQCQLLWGPSGRNGPEICYLAKCRHSNETNKKCRERDATCGVLQCTHAEGGLQFGNIHRAITTKQDIPVGHKSVSCVYVTQVIEGEKDAGEVPNGAKCGEGQMCVNQTCMPVYRVRHCASNCSGNGVCNNLGHCHCALGFNPPECDTFGPGGSLDSGPATHPEGNIQLAISLYSIFLGVVPLMVLVAVAVHFYCHKRVSGGRIATTEESGRPMYKPSFFRLRAGAKSGGVKSCGQQDSSPRPDITKQELVSTTNPAVMAVLRKDRDEDSPQAPLTRGSRFSVRIRKLSLSKGRALRLAPMRGLLEPSDSSGASTPDTPPVLRPAELGGLSVARLAARFHDDEDVVVKTPTMRPRPPSQSRKPRLPQV